MSLGDRAGGVDGRRPRLAAASARSIPRWLERAIANVVDNAMSWSPPALPVRVEGGAVGDASSCGSSTAGPASRPADRDRVFQPFQRLGDAGAARRCRPRSRRRPGFTEAIGGELQIDDTPGGGTTMVFRACDLECEVTS